VKLEDEALFMWSHALTLEARVEVVHPPQAAALARPVEPCMEVHGRETKGEEDRVSGNRLWNEYSYLSFGIPHPSNLILWQ
jgi:hypothetical protein